MNMQQKLLELNNMRTISPLISVVIATYNNGKLLYEAIDSVLLQNYPRIEIIICDDCSEFFDEVKVFQYVLRNAKSNIVKTRIIANEKNIGTVRNINNGIMASDGEYLCFIAADDVYNSNEAIQTLYNCREKKGSMICTGLVYQCDSNLNIIDDHRTTVSNLCLPKFYLSDKITQIKMIKFLGIFPFVTQASLFSRDFFIKYGYFDQKYVLVEDLTMLARIMQDSIHVNTTSKYIIKHRLNVGISANKKTIDLTKKKYYADMLRHANESIWNQRKNYGYFYARMRAGVADYRFKYCEALNSNDSIIKKSILILFHIDSLIYYVVFKALNGVCQKRIYARREVSD